MATLDNGRSQTTSYSYDGVGNRAGMVHPNGTVVEYQYDVRNRLKSLVHKASSAAGAAILLSLSYSVDASGLRTQIAETRPGTSTAITRVTDYQYDAVKRLTRETVSGSNAQTRGTSWTYDKVGNRKTESSNGTITRNQTYTYDANDRLLSETGTQPYTYSYDQAGNLIEKKQGATVVAAYEWDSENRLTRATLGTGASQKIISYSYDPNGIRRAQELQDASVHTRSEHLIDPNQPYAQVLEDWEASAAAGNPTGIESLSNVYVYGDDLISQTLLINNAASSTQIYHYDGLGTTRALSAYNVDGAGNPVTTGPTAHGAITDRYAYTAFGESDPAGTSGNTSGTTENNYRYTGEQLDPNLGFYYLRARYMDPRVGRFLGMDAWGGLLASPASLHKYIYANANSVTFVDPSGRISLAELSAAEDIQAILNVVSRGEQALRFYGKVNSAIDLVLGIRQMLSMFDGDLTASVPRYFPPWVNFQDAADKFAFGSIEAIGIGSSHWITGYVRDFIQRKRLTAYVLYMPVLVPQIPSLVGSGLKINGKPLKIGLGAPAGRAGSLAGVGVVMGTEKMLFRMDIGLTPSGHLGGGSEIQTFDKAPFSFHVYDWRGGPR